MLLSGKAISTLEAVLDIACNARPNPVRSGEIAARVGRPKRYLEKVMQQLAHAGILKGVRGPRGGYMLARERRRIPVGEILRIVAATESNGNGNGERTANTDNKTPPCGMAQLQQLCAEIEEEFFARLDKITIEDLCAARQSSANAPHLDFTI